MPLPPDHLLLRYNPEWFTFMVLAYLGCSGKKAIKRIKYGVVFTGVDKHVSFSLVQICLSCTLNLFTSHLLRMTCELGQLIL